MHTDLKAGNRASIEYWQALADERAQQKKAACAALETQLAQVCTVPSSLQCMCPEQVFKELSLSSRTWQVEQFNQSHAEQLTQPSLPASRIGPDCLALLS